MKADTLQFVLFLYIQQLHKISIKSSLVTGDEWPSRTRSPDLESARTATSGKNLDENSHFTNASIEAIRALGFVIAASIDGNR